MIRPLRRRHLWMIVIVGTVTALLAVAGLLARRPIPTVPLLDEVGISAADSAR